MSLASRQNRLKCGFSRIQLRVDFHNEFDTGRLGEDNDDLQSQFAELRLTETPCSECHRAAELRSKPSCDNSLQILVRYGDCDNIFKMRDGGPNKIND